MHTDLISFLLIAALRFSPSAIPQMSDIHILFHLTSSKEEEKTFLMLIRGEYKTAIFWILDILKLFHLFVFKAK